MLKTAILMLACRDYEALEIALAAHVKFLQPEIPFYILQNCRGTYDAERTLGVAKRYARLFPRTIRVIEEFDPDTPFVNISRVLRSKDFEDYDFVCKVDEDVFPLTAGWFYKLLTTWKSVRGRNEYAFVTPLINNNNWGFAYILEKLHFKSDFLSEIAFEHFVGDDKDGFRIVPSSDIEDGANGTIWGYPHIARWLHERTALCPTQYVEMTKCLAPTVISGRKRYSIGCIMFDKYQWTQLQGDSSDDELLWHVHCLTNKVDMLCIGSVPFVHISYFTQREENRDLYAKFREVYERYLDLPFPIGLYRNPMHELESRLRWLETRSIGVAHPPNQPAPQSRSVLAIISQWWQSQTSKMQKP